MLLFSSLLAIFLLSKCAHYGIILSGKSGFSAYPHQAASFHIYRVFKEQGLKDEDVHMLAYDDARSSTENNQFDGQLYSRPHGQNVHGRLYINFNDREDSLAQLKDYFNLLTAGNIFRFKKDDTLIVYITGQSLSGLFWVGVDAIPIKFFHESMKIIASQGVKILVFMDLDDIHREMLELEAGETLKLLYLVSTKPGQVSQLIYWSDDLKVHLNRQFSASLGDSLERVITPLRRAKDLLNILRVETSKSEVQFIGNEELLDNFLYTWLPGPECSADPSLPMCRAASAYHNYPPSAPSDREYPEHPNDCMYHYHVDSDSGATDPNCEAVKELNNNIKAVFDEISTTYQLGGQAKPQITPDLLDRYDELLDHCCEMCAKAMHSPYFFWRTALLLQLAAKENALDELKKMITDKCRIHDLTPAA